MLLYLIAILSPILLLFLGAVAKKIVRGPGWRRQDLYLGVELTLAAVSSGLVQIYDLTKQSMLTQSQAGQAINQITLPIGNVLYLTGFLILSFFVFVFSISIQQDLEAKDARRAQPSAGAAPNLTSLRDACFELPAVAVILNVIGLTLMILFVLYIKGV